MVTLRSGVSNGMYAMFGMIGIDRAVDNRGVDFVSM
jgi:hypothetical protein